MSGPSNADATAVFYIGIYDSSAKPAKQLLDISDVQSFGYFQRASVLDFMRFTAATIAERTATGIRQSVEEQKYMVHAYTRSEGCTGIIITNSAYPKRIPHELLNRLLDEFLTKYPRTTWGSTATFDLPSLKDYIVKYQQPSQADNISRIQAELDETKIVLHKTIESVLERGENLNNLVQKSDNLSSASKMFYTTAKKQNSCCVVM
ncbi:palmitoyltransferase [Orbilia ellipsospora]|uniref:Synaptobrevin homolog YKT6 n=1 Tax=Orbilia ellipsospora TaxID=2528407 RepID=A0AAV9XRY5_9PEZI